MVKWRKKGRENNDNLTGRKKRETDSQYKERQEIWERKRKRERERARERERETHEIK